MIAGDANADLVVDENDITNFWKLEAGLNGYLNSDYNFNSEADNRDKNDWWAPNLGCGCNIPD
jgi:hypothetical protein